MSRTSRLRAVGLALTVVPVAALPANAMAAHHAKGHSHSAKKHKKKAKTLRGPQGPQGPQGPAGPQGARGPQGANGVNGANGAQGAQGAQGPNGTARAYGAVNSSGVLNATRRSNIVSVTRPFTGIYCITPAASVPLASTVLTATPDYDNDSTNSGLGAGEAHVEWDSAASNCPSGTFEVKTYQVSDSASTDSNGDTYNEFDIEPHNEGFSFIIA